MPSSGFDAESGTTAYCPVPAKAAALPMRPELDHRAPPVKVALPPGVMMSAAVVPVPSSKGR